MNYVLDILGCATVSFVQLSKVFATAIIVQGLVYRLTGFSIWNNYKKFIMKGVK